MTAAVAHMIPLPRGPIKGTLSDADVKDLIVRAARTVSLKDVHAIIKTFAMNRLALVQVIEALKVEVTKSKAAGTTSAFDRALLQQLTVMRDEIDGMREENNDLREERDQAIVDRNSMSERLLKAEQLHDMTQRVGERLQCELLMAKIEVERLGKENGALASQVAERTEQLQSLMKEVTALRDRLKSVESQLAYVTSVQTETIQERDALKIQLATAFQDIIELKSAHDEKGRMVAHLRNVIKDLHFERANIQKSFHFIAAENATLRFQQAGKAQVGPPALTDPIAVGANVVAFASNAELTKLREQLKARDTTMASKDQSIAQLTGMNNAMKARMGEIESRFNQIEAMQRAQIVAHESLAKTLIEMLPIEQRDLYTSPSYDASSLMLIADALKRQREEQSVAQYVNEGLGHTIER